METLHPVSYVHPLIQLSNKLAGWDCHHPLLQRTTPRLRDVKELVQRHTVRMWQS